ncbi:MAG: DUF4390 domain-containing protein [Gammaproteobacteria bacterium]|nr:DUF4390 domain-containing protein [Gammaproteobacteria bacterium]MBU1624599.1 DUF4390 domain-containing protein [Gammaproteobacteria bacterium]MBU1982443.1 DUF4390 domain-containing protein [Gammaproteobacteria bacterium]
MPCCAKLIRTLLRSLCAWMLIFGASTAIAEGIEVKKAEARLTSEGYLISADFDIQLPPQVEEALRRGVILYFESELSVHRSRWYWMDTEIASYTQTSKLSFNTLTQQYRLTRGGLYQSFLTLSDALHILGRQVAPPIEISRLDMSGDGYFSRLVKKGSEVGAVAWMSLDLTQLPKPMQMNALTSEQWKVESEHFHWDISPEPPGEEEAP